MSDMFLHYNEDTHISLFWLNLNCASNAYKYVAENCPQQMHHVLVYKYLLKTTVSNSFRK